jgi:hypothetical protein
MCIMMLADLTAFISLVFGYFFFWTVRPDFLPRSTAGPGVFWPVLAAGLLLCAWSLTLLARRWNRRDKAMAFYAGLLIAVALSVAGGAALLAGPWFTGLDPKSHVYPATVWLLAIWTTFHVAYDGALRHGHGECCALLAFCRAHGRHRGRSDCGFPASGVMGLMGARGNVDTAWFS